MKEEYITPGIKTFSVEEVLQATSSRYNDVGNFGFGDEDDDDREGDDNWDKDWSWDD